MEINDHKFYSVDVDVKRDFKICTGYTEEELNELEYKRDLEKQQIQKIADDENISKLDSRIEEGSKCISIYKKDAWKEFILNLSQKGKNYNHAMDTIIKYLKYLTTDISVEELATIYINEFGIETAGWYSSSIATAIAKFSDRGIEFFQEIEKQLKEDGVKINKGNKIFLNTRKDINRLNDMNVPFEVAEELVNSKLFNIEVPECLNVDVFETNADDQEYAGVNDDEELVICKCINNYLVAFEISENKIKRYIYNVFSHKVIITENDEHTLTQLSSINRLGVLPLKKNIKLLADLYKKVEKISNSSPKMIANILMVRRELFELANPINYDDELTNVEALAEGKILNLK